MAAPVLSSLGERLRERTQELAPDDHLYDYAHAHLCEGMMLPFLQVAEIIDPPDPYQPWEILFDADLCPVWALPWLGQIVGVRIPKNWSEQDQRDLLKGLGGFKRGSPGAIRSAIKLTLTGNKTVIFRERDAGEAYRLEIVTDESETPDLEKTRQAIAATLPAGILLVARTVVGWDYQGMQTAGGTYAQQSLDYISYANLSLDIKG